MKHVLVVRAVVAAAAVRVVLWAGVLAVRSSKPMMTQMAQGWVLAGWLTQQSAYHSDVRAGTDMYQAYSSRKSSHTGTRILLLLRLTRAPLPYQPYLSYFCQDDSYGKLPQIFFSSFEGFFLPGTLKNVLAFSTSCWSI